MQTNNGRSKGLHYLGKVGKLLSKDDVTPTSLTPLTGTSVLTPNYYELAAMLVIKFIASVGVLSTNAPPLAASIILISIGVNPS